MAEKIYQLRVDLQHASPPIWRRLLVPTDILLHDLHQVLQIAFDWHNSHLHAFVRNRNWYQPPGPFSDGDEVPYTGMRLNKFLKKTGDKLEYLYDFGDSWNHILKLEKILPADSKQQIPACTGGKRLAPFEDVGGVWGFEEMIAAVNDKKHPEHKYYTKELGYGKIDPTQFDRDEINARLSNLILGQEPAGDGPQNPFGPPGGPLGGEMPQNIEDLMHLLKNSGVENLFGVDSEALSALSGEVIQSQQALDRALTSGKPAFVKQTFNRLTKAGIAGTDAKVMIAQVIVHCLDENGELGYLDLLADELAMLPLAPLEDLLVPIVEMIEDAEGLEDEEEEPDEEILEEVANFLHFLRMGTVYGPLMERVQLQLMQEGKPKMIADGVFGALLLQYINIHQAEDAIMSHRTLILLFDNASEVMDDNDDDDDDDFDFLGGQIVKLNPN